MKKILFISVTVALSLVLSCVPTPTQPDNPTVVLVPDGTYVVCEGLWRQNNATVSYINPAGVVIRDAVSAVNPGLQLGDTASDILVENDTMWVVVNTSKSIEKFQMSTGKWLGRQYRTDNREPYRICRLNDSIAIVSNLYDDSISELNLRTMQERIQRITVGPAPEGVAVLENRVFVANSGLGDYRSSEPDAGTMYVLNNIDYTRISVVKGLPNIASIRTDATTNRVWASYRNLTSLRDSLGGVVCLHPISLQIIGHWRFASPRSIVLDPANGNLYVLHTNGISRINRTTTEIEHIVEYQSGNGNDVWYSLDYNSKTQELWVGNARSYVTDGQAIVFSTTGKEVARYDVGLNPTAFGF